MSGGLKLVVALKGGFQASKMTKLIYLGDPMIRNNASRLRCRCPYGLAVVSGDRFGLMNWMIMVNVAFPPVNKMRNP
jgi:hypothetical protein